ncbi:unnamed protein product [Mycena citricolor]|uniref:Uncharacterized protein n=1 Tax=Mycena citricolor TaxID=2018698 RepID=A0AAD2HIA8_9AGAR|nr:unnamed protein product [Mycena citricolor]
MASQRRGRGGTAPNSAIPSASQETQPTQSMTRNQSRSGVDNAEAAAAGYSAIQSFGQNDTTCGGPSNVAAVITQLYGCFNSRWVGYWIDADGVAWAPQEVIAQDPCPELKYFWGEHTETQCWLCSLCTTVYQHGTSTSICRKHLIKRHMTIFFDLLREHGGKSRTPFSIKALVLQIIRVIVANDLSLNLINNRKFRDLMLLLNQSLLDSQIPHRTTLHVAIIVQWETYYGSLKQALQSLLGEISFTLDLWSSKGMYPYLAVTLHWLARNGQTKANYIRHALLAFRRVRGSHSGTRIARIMIQILSAAGIVEKAGHFTMDNASSNTLFMQHLKEEIVEIVPDSTFKAADRQVRCFSHIINLCSQAVNKAMEKIDRRNAEETVTNSGTKTAAGPIRRARKTVAYVQKSGQRWDALEDVIKEGNKTQLWLEKNENAMTHVELKAVQLLPDVKTRWDSMFYMLQRLRYLKQPVIKYFTSSPKHQQFIHKLETQHWNRLELLELVLQQPHVVQTVMAWEGTPMMAEAIPAYELFISAWEAMCKDNLLAAEGLDEIIEPGLVIAEKYHGLMKDTAAYAIAMLINPTIKFLWITQNWSPLQQEEARELVFERDNALYIPHPSSPSPFLPTQALNPGILSVIFPLDSFDFSLRIRSSSLTSKPCMLETPLRFNSALIRVSLPFLLGVQILQFNRTWDILWSQLILDRWS